MLDIIERNNKDNQNYIDIVKSLLYYFKLGGFYIISQENYGYRIYINKKDAEIWNGHLISIRYDSIHIYCYRGLDEKGRNIFTGWKMICNDGFITESDNTYNIKNIIYYIHGAENNWPEIAKKKRAVSDKKLSIEKDFENEF